MALVFKHVGQVGCDVQNILDVVLAQHIQIGGVFGTAQVKVGEDLDREGGLVSRDGALLRFRCAAGFAVRLPVGAVRADAEIPKAQDGQWGGGAGTGAVQEGLTVFWVLCLEPHKPP